MSRKPRFSAAEALNLIFQVPGDGQESDNSDFSGEEGGLSEENSDSDGEFMLSDDDLKDNADIHGDVGQPIVQCTGENPAVQINGGGGRACGRARGRARGSVRGRGRGRGRGQNMPQPAQGQNDDVFDWGDIDELCHRAVPNFTGGHGPTVNR